MAEREIVRGKEAEAQEVHYYVPVQDFIRTSPEKAAEIWGKEQGIDLEVAKAAIKNYPLEKWSSRLDPAGLKAVGDDMVTNKQIKEPPPWDKIVDQSFLAPALRTTM